MKPLPEVPVFTEVTYADLSARFKAWLDIEHGLSVELALTLAGILIDRRNRYAED
jgi:hypothetical protein